MVGDSAGGILPRRFPCGPRIEGEFYIPRQVLVTPPPITTTARRRPFASIVENGSEYLLTSKRICEYMGLYKRDDRDLKIPIWRRCWLRIFSNQPDTLVITAEFDPLQG